MLRSLDPDKDFEEPKSKRFVPTKTEEKKFSPGELEYVQDGLKRDEEISLQRAVNKQQREAALKALGIGGGP